MLFDQYKNKTKMIVLKMHLHGGKKNENYNVLKKVSRKHKANNIKEKIRNSSFNFKNYSKKKSFHFN